MCNPATVVGLSVVSARLTALCAGPSANIDQSPVLGSVAAPALSGVVVASVIAATRASEDAKCHNLMFTFDPTATSIFRAAHTAGARGQLTSSEVGRPMVEPTADSGRPDPEVGPGALRPARGLDGRAATATTAAARHRRGG